MTTITPTKAVDGRSKVYQAKELSTVNEGPEDVCIIYICSLLYIIKPYLSVYIIILFVISGQRKFFNFGDTDTG